VVATAPPCFAEGTAGPGRPEFTGGRYSPRTRAILDTLRPDPSVLERTYPETWDWRELGGVTPLRDQGTCEFCWAFAAYAEIESGILINEGLSLNLAEQQPADCNAEGHDCDSGGYPGSAFDLARIPGAVAEECMPYIDDNGTCRQRFCEKIAFVDGYTYTAANVDAYKAAIMEAPIAACDGVHCILIIGWDDSIQSWICKDSLYGGFWSYYAYDSSMTWGAVRSINPHTPRERRVPEEFPTIQAALDASQRGDVIKVAGGVYEEAIAIPPMRTLEGGYDPTFTTRDPETYPTVIDAGGAYVGVECGESLPGSERLIVDGFEITNAFSAGLWVITGEEVVLRDLEIHGCGSGIVLDTSYMAEGSVRIESCVIRDNAFDGVQVPSLGPHPATVSWSAIYGNGGSGISSIYSSVGVVNCTVVGNGLDGVTVGNQAEAIVLSSIVTSNGRYGVFSEGVSCEVTFSDVWDNATADFSGCEAGNGCLCEDPVFCDPEAFDFRLHASSGCVGAGDFGQDVGAFGIGCPPGPTQLEVLQAGASLVVSWSPPPVDVVVDHYVVYRDTLWSGRVAVATIEAPDTVFVDVGIPACEVNDYCVTAVDTSGLEGASSEEISGELCYAGPANLEVSFDEGGNEMSWEPADGPVESYVIMRSTEADPPDSVGWVPAPETHFVDDSTGDCARDNFAYGVVPVYDTSWRGFPSETVAIDPAPAAPTNLAVEWSGVDAVLSWSPNCESDFRRYWIYRDVVPFSPPPSSNLLIGFTQDTTYVDPGLDPEDVYFYRITASDASSQKSAYSEIAYLGSGDVLTVPSPYPTIQAAIDAAAALDTVLVAAGNYDENVTLKDAVSVVAPGGPGLTSIRSSVGAVVSGVSLVDITRLAGFTLDGLGSASACLDCPGAFLRVEDCVLTGAATGASFRFGGAPEVSGSTFTENQYGVACADSAAPFLAGNTFDGNTVCAVFVTGDPGPEIGRTHAEANDFLNRGMFQVLNAGAAVVDADYNYWGDVCVDPSWFSGTVDYVPWTDESHTETFFECGSGVAGDEVAGPSVSHNFPNPFNPSTSIALTVPQAGERVRITIYDLAGRRVRTLLDTEKGGGRHVAVWDGTNEDGRVVAPGVYFYRAEIGDALFERKMVMLK
jgi:fibronectin type 3 domain-containing protein